ncbi:MAG TPA: hypothetical protein PKD54_12420, partial [Pirellulaceae bacterium]|nr:hypothetical protein [Pirellulaceae bacterium]
RHGRHESGSGASCQRRQPARGPAEHAPGQLREGSSLARHGGHIVSGPVEFRVRTWSREPVQTARGRIDGGPWFELKRKDQSLWTGPIAGDTLAKGEHDLEVQATDAAGQTGQTHLRFMVDRSGRYTAYPRVKPEVTYTKYC